MGVYLKFLNREESIHQLLAHAQKQYGFYKNGYEDKDFQFATCSGDPGLRKVTRVWFSQCISFLVLTCFPRRHSAERLLQKLLTNQRTRVCGEA